MAETFIEAGNLNEAVRAFAVGDNQLRCWAVKGVINTTVLFLGPEQLYLPPVLAERARFYPGELESLTHDLLARQLLHAEVPVDEGTRKRALIRTKQWGTRNTGELRKLVDTVFKDASDFLPWLDWATRRTWTDPNITRGAMFDRAIVKNIASVTGHAERDILELHKLSCDSNALKDIITNRERGRTNDFRLMAEAYTLAFMLRGRYYDAVAQLAGLQLAQHPLREAICTDRSKGSFSYNISNTLETLARIIVFGAASAHRTLKDRLRCWVDNICRVRPLILTRQVPLAPAASETSAIDIAVRAARAANVEMGGASLTRNIDRAASLGIGLLTGVTLDWYVGAAVAYGAQEILDQSKVLDSVGRLFHNSETRLKNIGSGRIKFTWKSAKQ